MTKEQKLKTIAELDGDLIPHTPTEQEVKSGSYYQLEPAYLTSYDAILPVIRKWCLSDDKKYYRFEIELSSVLGLPRYLCLSMRAFIPATPKQLSDALIKASGKWVELEPDSNAGCMEHDERGDN